jgi:hypothetical protein
MHHEGIEVCAIAMVGRKPVLVGDAGDDAEGPAPLFLFRYRVAYLDSRGLRSWVLMDSREVSNVQCGQLPINPKMCRSCGKRYIAGDGSMGKLCETCLSS